MQGVDKQTDDHSGKGEQRIQSGDDDGFPWNDSNETANPMGTPIRLARTVETVLTLRETPTMERSSGSRDTARKQGGKQAV